MQFQIRQANLNDIETIVEFNVAMAHETENKTLDYARLTAGVRALFDEPQRGVYYVAAAGDGAVIGQTLITTEWSDWRNGEFWWFQSVYVRPDWRKKGVFKALYKHVLSLAKNDPHVCGLRLYVEKNNVTAQKTYRTLGMSFTPYLVLEYGLCTDNYAC